ncbi:helix-turn-helix domain-containing protein [Streptococcus gordonii]|uniref:Helix-turn-helix domain-containing protein n=1 Tax=Streptococcus gordonii TaxID=1302 RepID=A0AB35FS09_STRGN|nr:helix-turn-helix domain-containing protein [Streptococcus gordonii]MBZ2127009.1 helix-turn-helix domain-containing protein [Streptococcus gordonii]MBZ2129323.1 helix-turn-helix domain-containing protein [Streptococcus gordonii]MCB6585026.1 helix-turn-helix domain-containing protein [Streptococcus gordonii]MCB7054001.1 helix-turn-helix domain-containing protein [Streptococcus gordonii]MCB7056088.1 helix-turn-helix domain-containing protein [Streptococcus gordonii]
MYLADLMEKSEAGQFIVLSYLQQHSTSSLKDVMSETGFSKATLTKYISLINDKASDHHVALSIQLQDETLGLSVGPDTKGRDIRRLFLGNAVKYQILDYLLYHQQFLAHQLAQELMISEATLGRHISGLNQILSEFELSIQNGRLKGPEHQIRYLYFCLFRKVWSSQDWEKELQKPERRKEVVVLEELCGAQLSQGQRLDLALWTHITQQRLRVNACQFKDIEQKMQGYFENIFYQRLHRRTNDFFAGQHITLSQEDGEMMIFFSFLLSHRVLPLHTMEYILGFGGEIASLITQLIQEMKGQNLLGDYIEDQVTYELSQLCASVFLFKGYLLQDKYKHNLELRHPYLWNEYDYRQVADTIFSKLPIFQQGTSLDKKVLWEWLQLMEYIAENDGQVIKIGMDLIDSFIVVSSMTAILRRYLEYNRFITIESYDLTRNYDLIITNNPIHQAQQVPIYYLKNDLDLEDLAQIRHMIFH